MSKKNKNGVDSPNKSSSTKKLTKKDLELLISSQEDKHLRLKAEFDNYRKRKDSEISSLLKYEGKSFIMDFLSILDNISRGIESYKEDDIKKAYLLGADAVELHTGNYANASSKDEQFKELVRLREAAIFINKFTNVFLGESVPPNTGSIDSHILIHPSSKIAEKTSSLDLK